MTDRQMVINLTSQARIYFYTGSNPQKHKTHYEFRTERIATNIRWHSHQWSTRVVIRPNDPTLKTTVFHPREMTLTEGDISAILENRPPTIVYVVKWVKMLYTMLNVRVTASNLKAIIRQYMSENDVRVALLHHFNVDFPLYRCQLFVSRFYKCYKTRLTTIHNEYEHTCVHHIWLSHKSIWHNKIRIPALLIETVLISHKLSGDLNCCMFQTMRVTHSHIAVIPEPYEANSRTYFHAQLYIWPPIAAAAASDSSVVMGVSNAIRCTKSPLLRLVGRTKPA